MPGGKATGLAKTLSLPSRSPQPGQAKAAVG